MKTLWHDYETFNELDLKAVGVSAYARHPSLEIILASWSLDDGETVKQYDRFRDGRYPPNEFLDALEDERIVKAAWNFPFEWNITKHALGIDVPPSNAFDPMVVARSLSLPGSLAEACRILNMPESEWKHDGGKALINLFCKPRKPTKTNAAVRNDDTLQPVKWEKFRAYNVADIRAMVGCWFRMKKWDLSCFEWRLWEYDRQINEAGIPVNLDAIDNACRIVQALTEDRLGQLGEITGLDNPNSGEQLLGWLRERDYPFADMKIGHVRRALKEAREEGDGDTDYAIALERRTEISKASIKKYSAYQHMANDDGLLRNMHVFNGAGRTCRWSGTGLQVHNMARPHWMFEKEEMQIALARHIQRLPPSAFDWLYSLKGLGAFEALSSGVRGAIQAPPGYVFVSADFNAIENRVLGYMASEDRILRVFREDRCPYIDFGTFMYHRTYDDLWNEYKVLKLKLNRQNAKPAVLGCGYRLGAGHEYEDPATGEILATGLLGYARGMGVDLTVEQAENSVKVWRETYSKVSDGDSGLWANLENAFWKVIRTGRRAECEMFEFEKDGPFVTMRLPSGRRLFYLRPRIEDRMKPWGDIGPTITYEGIDSRSTRKAWGRVTTHSGKVTENGDQAIARDALAEGIVRCMERGVDVRLHVHDEIVALAREDDAERVAKIMSESMSEPMDWAPGLPLKAVAEISPIYVKT